MKAFKKMGIALLLAAAMLISPLTANTEARAASAAIAFEKDLETVRVDDVVAVTLKLTADAIIGAFEGYISYNSDVLDFVTGPETIVGGEGILKINDSDPDARFNERSYLIFFKATGIGSCDIKMRGNPEIYQAETDFPMSVSSSPLTIDVLASQRASSDASLAAMKISPGTLTPEFSPEVFEYSVTVPFETTTLLVSAVTSDAKANVKIEGNDELDVGQNRVLLLVTAEDGSLNKYVIYAAREPEKNGAAGDQSEVTGTPADGENTENGTGETSNEGDEDQNKSLQFFVTEEDGELILETYSRVRYTIENNPGDIKIPEGYFKTSILISRHSVTAYSPTEDLSSDFLLLILSKNGGAPELYSFDRVEKTLQRYSSENKSTVINSKTSSGYAKLEDAEQVAAYEKSLHSLTLVIAILSGVCMLLLILTIRLAMKSREKKSAPARRTGTRSSRR
ncbi:MAG: cadherin-like beta sandwich domain-containing protein [Lachnospiraceae bacterium]|nr:cadherin-like beta sandwich domain-containing protein [Lachnospiraceae bacterium]